MEGKAGQGTTFVIRIRIEGGPSHRRLQSLERGQCLINILFVDDEAHVLDGLRRSMRSMRHEWDVRFAASAADALASLATMPADAVISDMRMPGMDGAQLLNEVKRLYPGTIRFILSGHAEPTAVLRAASTAHQYIGKPCDAAVLRTAISRAQTLKNLLSDARIAAWAGEAEALPSLPAAYQQIVTCLQRKDASIADVAKVIEGDLATSTMILKIANSAFFGAGHNVRSTERAVSFLGIDNVAALVLAHNVFKPRGAGASSDLDISYLWQHSLKTAAYARSVAIHEKWHSARADDAFMCGMLHDLGHLVLASAEAGPATERLAESYHAQVGAYLVGLWGFPDPLVEAIALHHRPSKAAGLGAGMPTVLHVANLLAGAEAPVRDLSQLAGFDEGLLAIPGMGERLHRWAACVAMQDPDQTAAAGR